MKFVYSTGPITGSEHLKRAIYHAITNDNIPVVLNGYTGVDPTLRQKFIRIRDSFEDQYNPKYAATLDHFILKMDTRQKKDYHRALSEHINQLLDGYAELSRNVVLVPGKFDLSLEEIREFVNRYDLDVPEEKLQPDEYQFRISDGESLDLNEDGESADLLGIGGVPSFDSDFPDIIQHGEFHILTQTDWTSAIQIIDDGADYLVTSAGIESTFDPSLYEGEAFHIFNQNISAERLILDPCPARPNPDEIALDTMGIPLVHGRIEGIENPVYLVDDRGNREDTGDDGTDELSVRIFAGRDPVFHLSWSSGQWSVDENHYDKQRAEAAEEQAKQKPEPAEQEQDSRLEELLDRVAPAVLMLVEDEDEIIDIIEMRLFDRTQHFHIFQDPETALENFSELSPEMIILEDRVAGTDHFLENVKIQPDLAPNSVIKIYEEGGGPNQKPFRIHEDEHLVEPFEIMELFARIESELVHTSGTRPRVHELEYSFQNPERQRDRAEGLGKKYIRSLQLEKGRKAGFLEQFQRALGEASRAVSEEDGQKRIGVSFVVSPDQLTATVNVQDGDFIRSFSGKMARSRRKTGP